MNTVPLNVIYGLHDGNGVIRYVGQTSRGIAARMNDYRYKASLSDAKRAVEKWIIEIGAASLCSVVLETAESPEELDDLEIAWIAALGTYTCETGLNRTIGGQTQMKNWLKRSTPCKAPYVWTDERKEIKKQQQLDYWSNLSDDERTALRSRMQYGKHMLWHVERGIISGKRPCAFCK